MVVNGVFINYIPRIYLIHNIIVLELHDILISTSRKFCQLRDSSIKTILLCLCWISVIILPTVYSYSIPVYHSSIAMYNV